MQSDIDILFKVGFLSNLDYYLAKTLAEIANEDNQIVILSAALVSKASRDGHVCLDINQSTSQSISLLTASEDNTVSEKAGFDNRIEIKLPDKEQWIKALRSSKLVGEDSDCPLVLDSDNKLYLAKYFDYQKRIVKNILLRIKSPLPDIDKSTLTTLLDKYFKGQNRGISEQKKAVLKSILNNFLIISGGPGTGKTYITDKIATVFEKTFKASAPVTIVNTAPTGKAASKLQAGMTIHRLLKINNTTKLGKDFIQQNIVADLVIIDEASMIDIALMTKLLEAIPLNSKVIIIGDKNQLGAIETGSVFADICRSEHLDQYIVNLNYNFRSGKEKGIDK
ncbi:MAG: AAA family ATPase, partial [Desulfobacteraceae bacterium]|nr:AAA family ATPase [Desulfobacteraceae bacterium]